MVQSSNSRDTIHLCPEGVFGAPRTMPPYASVTSTDFTYTGQRDVTGTGLMDYKARFYSPTLGRFTQPDTIIPGAANPQSWNRFSYTLNNPILYVDPTGHTACKLEPEECEYLRNLNSSGGGGGGGDPDDDLDNDGPDWDEIAEPGDEFIAYTINGENYWAHCTVYSLGSSCTSSITYNLDGREALSLLLALKYNFYPNPDFLPQVASDTGSLLLSKGFPPYEGAEQLYDWYEFANKDTLSNAFDALGDHILLNNLGGGGPAYIPSVNITFTKGLLDIRPFTPFENFVSPGGDGTFHGSYAGVVMTITNTDDPSISTSVYLGEQSGYGGGFDTLLEVTRLLSE